jgi:hypothetical protein
MSETREGGMLVVSSALVPAVVFGPGGVDAILDKVKAEAKAVDIDISTKAGRTACASLAYKIARSKTALDDMGKSLGDEMRKQVDAINADRRRIREDLDALRDEVRGPLDRWEAREAARIEGHEAEVTRIASMVRFDVDEPPLHEIDARIASLTGYERDWQEFEIKGVRAVDAALTMLKDMRESFAALYAEREAEVLRRVEAEAQQRREREEQIAREAAERARIEAEEKAAGEAEAAAAEARRREEEATAEAKRREDELRAAAALVEQERVAAEERFRQEAEAAAEGARKREAALQAEAARQEQAKREAEERAAAEARRAQEAEAARREGERRAGEEAAAAERRHAEALTQARDEAVEAERQAKVAAAAQEREETRKREENRQHRAKFNGEAKAALMAAGLSAQAAEAAIVAIAKGHVPHVSIAY